MDSYPYEWVCVSPGGNAGKTSCHTWNTQMASPLHTQNIKLLAITPIKQLRKKKTFGGKRKILKMWNREIQKQILLTQANGICKYNWCQINLSWGYFFGIHWLWTIRMKVDLPTAYLLNNKKQRMLCERMQNCLFKLKSLTLSSTEFWYPCSCFNWTKYTQYQKCQVFNGLSLRAFKFMRSNCLSPL